MKPLSPADAGGPDGFFEYDGAELAERRGNDFLIVWKRPLPVGYEVELRWTKGRGSVHDVWGQEFHATGKLVPFGKETSLFDNKRLSII